MKTSSRNLVIVAVLLMTGGLFLPFWTIELEAPQFPEGLSMQIWLDRITGDVEKINGLNHYIGMKTIHEDEFAEFRIMPYALGGLILIGLIAALLRRRALVWAWLCLLLLGGILAFYDFYRWEYDYGHNLDPHAAIKIPGMSYQPPLIGYKQMLNFVAGSLPASGAYMVLAGALTVTAVLFYEQFFRKKSPHESL